MLLTILFLIVSLSNSLCDKAVKKPYVSVPIPLELPNRNDRANQCWLRVEDVDLIATVTQYCNVVHEFLNTYIYEYNTRKIAEDGVDLGSWPEGTFNEKELWVPAKVDPNGITDWKLTTILDTITERRLYVSSSADCSVVMYSREGMTNYKINCARMLYYFNNRTSSGTICRLSYLVLFSCVLSLILEVA